MHNQSRDTFPSDTKKSPKDCMAITLRSGKEFQEREEIEKKKNEAKTEKVDQNSMGCEKKQNITGLSNKNDLIKEQDDVAKKEEVRVYQPLVPFPQRLQ